MLLHLNDDDDRELAIEVGPDHQVEAVYLVRRNGSLRRINRNLSDYVKEELQRLLGEDRSYDEDEYTDPDDTYCYGEPGLE